MSLVMERELIFSLKNPGELHERAKFDKDFRKKEFVFMYCKNAQHVWIQDKVKLMAEFPLMVMFCNIFTITCDDAVWSTKDI